MNNHHDHHGHHMMGKSSVQTSSTVPPFTTTASPITTVLQTMMTTMMTPTIHQDHQMAGDGASHYPTENHSGHSSHYSHTGDTSSVADHMMMYFHSGVDAIVLFKEWNISSAQGMIGSVIGIFLMAVLYEGIKFFREYMFKRHFTSLEYTSVSVVGDDGKNITEIHKVARNRMFSWPHAMQTFLHVIQMVLSYFLMLIFMTYNVWLCLGVVLGAGTGYFLFGWKKTTVVDITEHCH